MKEENMVAEENIVVLVDEEGNELDHEIVFTFSFEEKEYAVLLPLDGSEEAVVYRMTENENDEFLFEFIEDDDEFDRVAQCYEDLLEEMENEDEEGDEN
jgi:uncharacterized protein YrzB (UPF0473 family)